MLVTLGTYRDRFEVPFLKASRRFFLAEGQSLMEARDLREYLLHVEVRLKQAADMVTHYLDVDTYRPLVEAVEAGLISPHALTMVHKKHLLRLDCPLK